MELQSSIGSSTKGGTNKRTEEINKSNKLVKISDRGLARWVTVDGYISDALASGSEDDKKLKAAEYPARKKGDIKVPDSKRIKMSHSFSNSLSFFSETKFPILATNQLHFSP